MTDDTYVALSQDQYIKLFDDTVSKVILTSECSMGYMCLKFTTMHLQQYCIKMRCFTRNLPILLALELSAVNQVRIHKGEIMSVSIVELSF